MEDEKLMRFKKMLFSMVIAFMGVFLSPSIALANEVEYESVDEALEEFLSHFDLDLVRNILGTDFDVDLTEYNTPRNRWRDVIRTRFITPHNDISIPTNMRHHETSENDMVRTRRGDILLVLRGVEDPFLAFDVGSGSGGRNRIYEWFSLKEPNQENIDAFNEIAARIQPHMDTIRSVVGVDFELIPHVFVSGQSHTAFDHRWRNNERWIFLDFGRNELDVDYFHSQWLRNRTGSNAHITNLGEAFILERPRGSGSGFELALRIDVGMQRNPVDRWHRGYFQYVLR